MPPREAKRNAVDEVVVLVDEKLANDKAGSATISALTESFASAGSVRVVVAELPVPSSVRWLTRKSLADENEWRMENHTVVVVDENRAEKFYDRPAREFLSEVLNYAPKPADDRRIKVLVAKSTPAKSTSGDKALDAEIKYLQLKKASYMENDCLVSHNVDVNVKPLPMDRIAADIVRATKSVIAVLSKRSDGGDGESVDNSTWFPKKSGPPVSVNKNRVGLANLWQRYLMQISRSVNVEQAKVISSDPDFSSIERATKSYSAVFGDERKAAGLLSGKSLRPSGATQSTISLGSGRPCVGPDTSRKVCRVLTTTNGQERI